MAAQAEQRPRAGIGMIAAAAAAVCRAFTPHSKVQSTVEDRRCAAATGLGISSKGRVCLPGASR
eukprot:5662251-Lingulodinium_polyedra.AAC.1